MKIGIIISDFGAAEKQKDPGVIATGLAKLGHEITVFYRQGGSESLSGIREKIITRRQLSDPAFWSGQDIEVAFIYSWLSLRYSRLIRILKAAGRKIILKLDSDGRLIYPLKPSYLRVSGLDGSLTAKVTHWLRLIEWSLAAKAVSRARLRQIASADLVIIESPAAKDNILASLAYWQRSDLGTKVAFLPNPVNLPETGTIARQKAIISVGRWSDKRKNARGLIDTFVNAKNNGWVVRLVGAGSESLKEELGRRSPELRIEAYESLSRNELAQLYNSSMIFFAPSLSESFNLSAAEGVCSGLTLAAKPLESFRYLAGAGRYGTLNDDLAIALGSEKERWERGETAADSGYWRHELSPERIAAEIDKLIGSL